MIEVNATCNLQLATTCGNDDGVVFTHTHVTRCTLHAQSVDGATPLAPLKIIMKRIIMRSPADLTRQLCSRGMPRNGANTTTTAAADQRGEGSEKLAAAGGRATILWHLIEVHDPPKQSPSHACAACMCPSMLHAAAALETAATCAAQQQQEQQQSRRKLNC